MRYRVTALVLCLGAALAGAACTEFVDPSDNVVTEFTGTLGPGEADEHGINITRNGEFTVRIRSIEPSEGAFLHVLMGLVDQGLCALLYQAIGAHNELIMAGEMYEANYCIQVADPGVLTQTVTYVIELSHP